MSYISNLINPKKIRGLANIRDLLKVSKTTVFHWKKGVIPHHLNLTRYAKIISESLSVEYLTDIIITAEDLKSQEIKIIIDNQLKKYRNIYLQELIDSIKNKPLSMLIKELKSNPNFIKDEISEEEFLKVMKYKIIRDVNKTAYCNNTPFNQESIGNAVNEHKVAYPQIEEEEKTKISCSLFEFISSREYQLMNVTEEELKYLRSIRFKDAYKPIKKDYIDLLFLYRNLETKL